MSSKEITWQAPEFAYREKNISWYWVSIAIAVATLAIAVWQKNFLFGFFVVAAEILIIVWGERKPREITWKIDLEGLSIVGERLFRYAELKHFGIVHDENTNNQRLVIAFQNRLKPRLEITIPHEHLTEIKELLAANLPETEIAESFLDTLERFLKL